MNVDEIVLQMTQASGDVPQLMQSKQWVYVNDSNNNSYSGNQITWDLSSLANSGRWVSWSESLLEIPIVFGYKLSTDKAATAQGPFALGLKNCFVQLVDSLEIVFGNTSISQITPYSNMFHTFKMLTTFCKDQQHKYGALLNFFPDSAEAYGYSAVASVFGAGTSCNAIVLPALSFAGAGVFPRKVNEGLLARLYNTNFPVLKSDGTAATEPSWAHFRSQLATLGKSQYKVAGAGAARVYYTECIATIRLRDISSFFERCGIMKGAFIKLVLNVNSGQVTSASDIDGKLALTSAGINLLGRTMPIMLSATTANSPLLAALDASTSVVMGLGIRDLTLTGAASVTCSLLSAARLYVPTYRMSPESEAAFLEANPSREIAYHDIYQYTINGLQGGQQFTQLITNGIVAPQYLVVMPILSGKSNITGQTISPLASPFASEPATTSAGIGVAQYNVQISGQNVYAQNLSYDFEHYSHEMASVNALNGGLTDEMSSGLIGFHEWSGCYRYIVSTLSRGTESDKLLPKSIQLQGQIVCADSFFVDLFCFVVYQRKIVIRSSDSTIIG